MQQSAVLHVAAEAHPLIKTGGLADVAGALPRALRALGVDARLLLPGYPAVLAGLAGEGDFIEIGASFGGVFGASRVVLMRGRLPGSDLPVYAIDAPWLYRRVGNPYVDAGGHGWRDNASRFGLLGWVAAQLAAGGLDPEWEPVLVHAHDWHAGLAPAYLRLHPARHVPTVFTVHNLAYQGRFPLSTADALGLPAHLLTPAGLEFHGDLSFMKAGLTQADRLTTVSPTYAREITTAPFGEGLEGVLRAREAALRGIRNGIDASAWDPAADPAIDTRYDAEHLPGKRRNRRALRRELGLVEAPRKLLLALVGRLTAQKGVDLVLAAVTAPLLEHMQLAVLGSGEGVFERGLSELATRHPGEVAVRIGFDEALAHRIVAGADAILVPSRFEPCGLTQMYGLRYGTVPVVRSVGGLADTVVDSPDAMLATGFAFQPPTASALAEAVTRAIDAFATAARWRTLMRNGMRQDFSWEGPAREYADLYRDLAVR